MAAPTITGDAPIASGSNTSGFIGSPFSLTSFAFTSGKTYLVVAHGACWTSGDAFGTTSGSTLSWSLVGSQSHSTANSGATIAAWVATASSSGTETVSLTETSTGAWHSMRWAVYEINGYNGIGATHNNDDSAGLSAGVTATITPTAIGSTIIACATADANQPLTPTGCTALNVVGAVGNYATDVRLTTATSSTSPLSLTFTTGGQNLWLTFAVELLASGGGGTVYNDSITESVSASDSLSSTAIFANALTETVTATVSLASAAIFGNSLTESVSASDSISGSLTMSASLSESVTASDALTAAAIFANALTEAVTASDSLASTAIFNNTISEAVSVTESISSGNIYFDTITESVSATDSLTANLIMTATITETISANATVGGPIFVFDD